MGMSTCPQIFAAPSPDPVLSVGPLRLSGRAFLAPMAGVTDLGMRRLACRFGASLTFSEMVASDFLTRGDLANKLKAAGSGIDLHVVQIAGREPHAMAEAARIAEASGAAMVDINMGCPAKKVTGGLAGSHLMRDLSLAAALVRAIIAAVRVPVTLKMRLGWDSDSPNAPELARIAEAEGVALVTVHGRTRCQFYRGRADWDAIGAVKRAVSVPVVANGDCRSLRDAATMLARSGADAVMIGRAAIGRPWLVGDIAHYLAAGAPRDEAMLETRKFAALEHYETLLESYGIAQGVRHARKHLAAYVDALGARTCRTARRHLVTSDDPRAVKAVLAEIFDSADVPEAA
jgi:tRNA-dihydrouridine synthase B